MNKINFSDLLADEKKKKKETKKQIKVERKKPLKAIVVDNENSQQKDINDIGYESSGLKNELDLSEFIEKKEKVVKERKNSFLDNENSKIERKKTFSCPHSNCSVEFAYEQHLKEHILNKHNKLKASMEKKIEISSNNPPIKKVKSKKLKIYHCTYKNCKRKFSLEMALNQHIKDKHMNNKLIEKKTKPIQNKKKIKIVRQEKIKSLSLIMNQLVSNNQLLSIIVPRKIHDRILTDILTISEVKISELLEKHHAKKYAFRYKEIKNIYLELRQRGNKISLKEIIHIECPFCESLFFSKNSLHHHIKDEHQKNLLSFLTENKIKKSYCKYCDDLIFDKLFKEHFKQCSEKKCEYCEESICKDDYEEHLSQCLKYKEKFWEENSSIKEIKENKTTLTNIEKHQAIRYQFKEDEELEPDLIDEEAYQKTFGTQLDNKSQQIRARVAFEHEKIYKQEEEDKSEIKIFLSKMYKGYCQVCGYTFKKTNGENSFERFNWNDKRVVKVKKNLVSTADSLSLCRNCSANIKWGAFYPNFVYTIRDIEDFKNKSYDEIREKLHKVVDEDIPKIFEPLLNFDDVYALEIELDGKSRNIYFTNEHLLQFVTYLQKEDEVEKEVKIKKRKKEIYTKNSWLARDENIPKELAIDFLRATIYHPNHSSGRPVSMSSRAYEIYKNSYHGWAIDLNANPFLVGKAIERCKIEINNYIENKISDFHELKNRLHYCIRGAVATSNNDEYNGYYPLEKGRFMKFGWNAIDVDKGVEFLIRELRLDKFLKI